MTSNYPRDLIGYNGNLPQVAWPGGARIALSFVLNYEEGGERCVLHGDQESEAFLSEIIGAQPYAGVRHASMESIYEYGSRAGVWRILELFRQQQIPLTIFAVAMAAERHPELIRQMHQQGHEICSHGYRWIDYQYMDKDEERQHLHKAIDILQGITGERPLGWYTGRDSPNTRELVVEEGGFLYDSDDYSDDLPYWNTEYGKPQLVIPYTLDTNDMRFATNQGFHTSEQFFQYLKDAFDVLYEEGAHAPKMLSIGMHCRLLGRPARFKAIQRFLAYTRQFPDVWYARRIDIARYWHEHHPYTKISNNKLTTCVPEQMTRAAFVEHFKDLYEHSPWVAERVFDRGLNSALDKREALQQVFAEVMLAASVDEQMTLINAHPDLAGKAAVAGQLTEASTAEQSGAGIHECTATEFAEFTQLNTAYKDKFGFPFIKAVKGSNRHQILAAFRQRIEHDVEVEFQQALTEINKIAGFRLATM